MLVFILSEESRPQKSYLQSLSHTRTTIPHHPVKSRKNRKRPKKTHFLYGDFEGIYMCIHQSPVESWFFRTPMTQLMCFHLYIFSEAEESRPQKSYPQSLSHTRTTIPGHQVKSREYLPEFERPEKTPFLYGDFEDIYIYMYVS